MLPSPTISALITSRARQFVKLGWEPEAARREAVGTVEREIDMMRVDEVSGRSGERRRATLRARLLEESRRELRMVAMREVAKGAA